MVINDEAKNIGILYGLHTMMEQASSVAATPCRRY